MQDPMDDAFGLPPMGRKELTVPQPLPVTADDDYEHARSNLYRLIEKGERQLDELGDIASVSQHAKAFEVYASLFKSVVDANKDLMAIKKTKRDIDGAANQDQGGGPKTVNNLIMTTEDVLKMIKGEK